MSGGALDYAYARVEDLAGEVARASRTIQHRAFATHLFFVAKALRDLEWMLSSDTAEGSEIEAINKVLNPAAMLMQAIKEAEAARFNLEIELAKAKSPQTD